MELGNRTPIDSTSQNFRDKSESVRHIEYHDRLPSSNSINLLYFPKKIALITSRSKTCVVI